MIILMTVGMALFTAIGLGFILADVCRVPNYKTSRAIHVLGKRQDSRVNPLEIWLSEIAHRLAGKIHLNEYKREKLAADLITANKDMTPEMFTAQNILKAGLIGVCAVPMLFFSKLMAILVLIGAGLMYYNSSKSISNIIKGKREKIESELPRLVAKIEKTLTHNRDILAILESYKAEAGPELRNELEITVADMRSGNYEVALTRLESRVGSAMMSEVVRGLISVIHGNETAVYWGSTALKFGDIQRQRLKAEAEKAPKRVKMLSRVLLTCFMLIYVVVIGQVLFSSLGGLML